MTIETVLDALSAHGSCRGFQGSSLDSWWFSHDPHRLQQAKQICRGCPVMRECREYALEFNERNGMWGGLTEAELRAVRKRRLQGHGTSVQLSRSSR